MSRTDKDYQPVAPSIAQLEAAHETISQELEMLEFYDSSNPNIGALKQVLHHLDVVNALREMHRDEARMRQLVDSIPQDERSFSQMLGHPEPFGPGR